ncbi:MAG: phosphoribosylformylglycinamidine cyclo-ligase [Endomicrobium sp.]|jgi:phosphoribosylformylglycinamidine cyclo-ligase|nr:phosphoribosylformylglycinamidine cyclo-ligase [Endomicrobium sp.]
MTSSITYEQAGVDIKAGNDLVDKLKKSFDKIGGFGGIFELQNTKYSLVSSTDGVGTKLKLAFLLNQHNTIGIDLVAMNVNDIICLGAKPIFFLDYFACNHLNIYQTEQVITGISTGCQLSNIQLIGGETAEMPDFYKCGEYDLAGFAVGIIETGNEITGLKIQYGDLVIGLKSSGPHSNGYSMIRKVFSNDEIKQYNKELLKPTTIYVKEILQLLKKFNYNVHVKNIVGIAHITGGSFHNKITRILPNNTTVIIQKGSWKIPNIFTIIQNKGNITNEDMYKIFNMGIGMVIIVRPNVSNEILNFLNSLSIDASIIGHVDKGKRGVQII